jgi:formylmethanofuran dehydrogenase subunit B
VCDDLRLTFIGNSLVKVEGACPLAEPWFDALSKPSPRPPARIDGKRVELDEAIRRAAELLSASRAPLIWGLTRSSTAGQRAAVLLAEPIGATIDTTASLRHGATTIAMQGVGMSTCSLGEVRNRADLVVFWRADPATTHPRHFERYSVDAPGLFVPRGRADRHVIVLDSKDTPTSRLADTFVRIPRGADFELISVLRQLVEGNETPADVEVGVPLSQLQRLAHQMTNCRYGAVFIGEELGRCGSGFSNVESLLRFVAELNKFTRFTARPLLAAGNAAGADAVLTWLTGFPFAVNFADGYPRYGPDEFGANELLERGKVDACLLVGSEGCRELSSLARQTLKQIPTIALDYPHVIPPLEATIQISTAVYGIHAAGTAYRMDDVPIPLRRLVAADYPTDHEVLTAIGRQLASSRSTNVAYERFSAPSND